MPDLTSILRRLRLRMILLVATAVLLAAAATGIHGYLVLRAELLRQVGDRLRSSADVLAAEVEDLVGRWRHRVGALASATAVIARLDAAEAPIEASGLFKGGFDALLASFDQLQHIALVDASGLVVEASQPDLVGRRLAATEWFAAALTAGTSIRAGTIESAPAIAVDLTTPIVDHQRIRGLIWVRLDLAPLFGAYGAGSDGGRLLLAQRNWRGDAVVRWPPSHGADETMPQAVRPNRIDRPIVHALRGNGAIVRGATMDQQAVSVIAATRHLDVLDWGLVLQQRLDDVLAPAHALGWRLAGSGGLMLMVILVATPLMERRNLRRLRQFGEQTSAILASIVDGIITTDKRGQILTANPAAAAMFGWDVERLAAQNVASLIPPAARAAHRKAMDSLRQNRQSSLLNTTRELAGLRADGCIFPLEISLSELVVDGRTQFTAVIRDISEREQARQQIERQAVRLNQVNRELAQRNAALEDQARSAHAFVNDVSHEFRTPLAVMREYGQILRDGNVGPLHAEQIECVDVILQRVDDLNIMIDDMLDMSRIEAGLLGISRKACTIDEILDRCLPLLRNRAMAAKVELIVEPCPCPPQIFADPEKVIRIIINLVVNACKFSNDGDRVRLWCRADNEAHQLIIGVTDAGPGIALENLKVIFDRFRQVDNFRRSAKGFGLGLAITKDLVELNLGDIEVDSKPGAGSTFWFTVPVMAPYPLLERFIHRTRLRHCGAGAFVLIALSLEDQASARHADRLDEVLRRCLTAADLLLRPTGSRWLLVSATKQAEADSLTYRLQREIERASQDGDPAATAAAIAVLGCWPIDKDEPLIARFAQAMDEMHLPAAECPEQRSVEEAASA